MNVDKQVKYGDETNWVFTLSDSSNDALNLSDATVEFRLKAREDATQVYFERDSGGAGSDFITIGTPPSDGQVTIRPTTSDYSALSDNYGVFIGEFKVTSDSIVQITRDYLIDIQESVH